MKKTTGFLLGFLVWSLGVFAQTAGGTFTYGPDINSAKIVPYIGHAANGDVIVFGGRGYGFISSATADLYNPETNTFMEMNMLYPHDNAVFVKLLDGTFLIAGGGYDYGVPAYGAAEIYDPEMSSFTAAGTMLYPRMQGSGATLTNGKVLIVGGWYSPDAAANAELYDPAATSSTYAGALITPRANPLVLPCDDGGAMVIGGYPSYGGSTITTVEYYDPVANNFTEIASEIIDGESGWTTTLDPFYRKTNDMYQLENGKYLIMLYKTSPVVEYTFATFDPATKTFEKFLTDIPLLGDYTDGGVIDYALNKEEDLVYLLSTDASGGYAVYGIVTVDLQTAKVYQPEGVYAMPVGEYLVYATLTFIEETGMLLDVGVSASTTDYFSGTNITYLIDPDLSVGIPIQEDLIVLQVYPNPVKEMLMLILPNGIPGTAIIEVRNLNGQILYRSVGLAGEHIMIPVASWPQGSYVISVNDRGNINSARFVVGGY